MPSSKPPDPDGDEAAVLVLPPLAPNEQDGAATAATAAVATTAAAADPDALANALADAIADRDSADVADPPTTPVQDGDASAPQQSTTPKSAPAATGPAGHHGHARKASHAKKPEPTLLADFLLGRPSAARVAAQRQARTRRKSVADTSREAVKLEMRQAAVRKLQPPTGVHSRVKNWQKTNMAAMMMAADPEATPTEPSQLAFAGDDLDSVTEEDRLRIRMRQQKKPHHHKKRPEGPAAPKPSGSGDDALAAPESANKKPQRAPTQNKGKASANDSAEKLQLNGAPKKRVVSDEHWLKKKNKSSGGPAPLLKDLQRTTRNPAVSRKIRDWAIRVNLPDPDHRPSTPKSLASTNFRHYHEPDSDSADERASEVTEIRGARSRSRSRSSRTSRRSKKMVGDDGIRVTSARDDDDNHQDAKTDPAMSRAAKSLPIDDGIRIKPMASADDGIRIRPSAFVDDGIRIKPAAPIDDGIRVRPLSIGKKPQPPSSKPGASRRGSREIRSHAAPSPEPQDKRPETKEDGHEDIIVVEEDSDHDHIEVTEEPESPNEGRPKKRPQRRRSNRKRPKSLHTGKSNETGEASWVSDEDSKGAPKQPQAGAADATKNLADIPFGFSAFSELNIPSDTPYQRRLGGKKPMPMPQQKSKRTSSFRAVPKVLTKIVNEGKKIIQETVDPPRQIANQPPSIEKWLNNTVEPFVETPASPSQTAPKKVIEKEWAEDAQARRRSSGDSRKTSSSTELTDGTPTDIRHDIMREEPRRADSRQSERPREQEKDLSRPPSSTGIRRSKATRGVAPSLKPSPFKKPLKEVFKDVFRGESNRSPYTTSTYETKERRSYESPESEPESGSETETETERQGSVRRSSGSHKSESEVTLSEASDAPPPLQGPRRKPPTRGVHELSTILSEVPSAATEPEMAPMLSQPTPPHRKSSVSSADTEIARKRSDSSRRTNSNCSQKSGLKRRLTRHSDLVSVLSLHDDGTVARNASRRSRPSTRRVRQGTKAALDAILKEFSSDENLYQRELKTLIDGIIPVLLSEAINSASTGNPTTLFGDFSLSDGSEDMSKAIVDMGVSLEKLKNYHKRAPFGDVQRLLIWLRAVAPIYNTYLGVWRLGFQGIVVNLAPPDGVPDDEDSLINALPRNANGDVINEEGERVDVAHFLKRPLFRVKMMARWLKGVDSVFATDTTRSLLKQFEGLQDKARRRHKEELARITDEDAIRTDTTRVRDLRTLSATDSVTIHRYRQVNAKDFFDFNLMHSNGQRLSCRVELVHRDNQAVTGDEGDILVRETDQGKRSWLLFPPITIPQVSARRGSTKRDLVVMVRGTYQGRDWYELCTLAADNEDQVLDWLDILGSYPVPPSELAPVMAPEPLRHLRRPSGADIPVGARRTPEPKSPPRPESRVYPRASGLPAPSNSPERVDKSPSPESAYPTYQLFDGPSRRDTVKSAKSHREDGAPPPPPHRTLSKGPNLAPPPEISSSWGVKRRTSSPLKHEYLPSEHSELSASETESGSQTETEGELDDEDEEDESGSDTDSLDIPETEIGISIKHQRPSMPPSLVSISTPSLTPSNSASQAGLHRRLQSTNSTAQTPHTKFSATVSHWYGKRGTWKEVSDAPMPIVVGAGVLHIYRFGDSAFDSEAVISLDLTPLSLLRRSTVVDLEIRSSVQPSCKMAKLAGGNFRFRCNTPGDCLTFYNAVHNARMNNEKYIQLANETRFRSFGEHNQPPREEEGEEEEENDGASSRRRNWFGRRNSYRAPSRAFRSSQDGASTTPSSTPSASSFLRRLAGTANLSFNLARSSIDKQNTRSASGSGSGGSISFHTGSGSSSSPRSPSISIHSGAISRGAPAVGDSIPIRLHLLVTATKWEDFGNCLLTIARPPPGWRQELRAYHGLEKRVTVTTIPRKKEESRIALDAVLGSGCFSAMGSRGVICGVWEELRDAAGIVGVVPKTGSAAGSVKKWCFQCATVAEASWVLRLVHEEVVRA